jgi:hypothetical protein
MQSPATHGMPQAPQFCGSFSRLTHTLPPLEGQEVNWGRHTHVPFTQASVFGQTMPHTPQASGLLLGALVHRAGMVPIAGQLNPALQVHDPLMHTAPDAHGWLHPPQLSGSVSMFVLHVEALAPQAMVPLGQAHLLFVHT